MNDIMRKLDQNYEKLKREHGVIDTRFYVGEIKNSTPEDFAEEANIVLEAYMEGKVQEVTLDD